MLIGQLLLSGLLIGQSAWSAAAYASIICAHDLAALADGSDGTPGPTAHDRCPACACPQSAQPLVGAPTTADIAVLRPRADVLEPERDAALANRHFHSPYASRAPPASA
jgi:hypothetical protein